MISREGISYFICKWIRQIKFSIKSFTVVGANLCVRRPLEINGKGIRGVRVAADKAYTVHSINIIFQFQYFVARCLSSYVSNIFSLHSMPTCFPSTFELMT
jgi:hypothetical protein